MIGSKFSSRSIVFVLFLAIFLLSSSLAFAEVGCCYHSSFSDGQRLFVERAECSQTQGSYFDPDDTSCSKAQIICACSPTFNRGYKFLAFFEGLENNVDYFTNFDSSIFASNPLANAECFAFCRNAGLAQSLYCNESSYIPGETTFCGFAEVTETRQYCCISANNGDGLSYSNRSLCERDCGVIGGQETLQGIVTDKNTLAPIANAILSISGPVSRTAYSDETGNYVFTDLQAGNYVLTASKSNYRENSLSIVISGMTTMNLELELLAEVQAIDCSRITQAGCQGLNLDSPDRQNCCNCLTSPIVSLQDFVAVPSTRSRCTDIFDNNCNGVPDIDEGSCSDFKSTAPRCGNGIWEPSNGEQCDADIWYCNQSDCSYRGTACGDGIYNPEIEACDQYDAVHCTDTCHDECYNGCYVKPTAQILCSSSVPCPEGAQCVNGNCIFSESAHVECTGTMQTKPAILSVTEHISNNVFVNFNNSCSANGYVVYRCETPDKLSDRPAVLPNSCQFKYVETQKTFTYVDSNIKPNMTYCYKIGAIYSDHVNMSAVVCEHTGPKVCFGTTVPGKYCDGSKVIECNISNEGKNISDCRSENATCLNKGSDAQCVFQSKCALCNIIYGVSPFDGITFIRDLSLARGERSTSCALVDSCYTDYQKSSVDVWHDCSNVASCYDYKTKDACALNKCRSDGVGDCTWSTIDGGLDILGLGVCRPVDTEKHNCSLCERENGILACNKQTCALYGQCYLVDYGVTAGNTPNERYDCLPKSQIGCFDFTTMEDCINSSSIWSYNPAFYFGPQAIVLNQSNNFVIKPSDDYFSFMKCKWDAESGLCYKDANDNNLSDCSIDDNFDPTAYDQLACQIDNKDPVTIADCSNRQVGENMRFNINVDEAVNVTLYSLSRQNDPSLPYMKPFILTPLSNQIALSVGDEYVLNGIQHSIFGLGGYYDLYYYSQDFNNNPEEVKNCTFYLDKISPSIFVRYGLTSNPSASNPDIYLSDVLFNLTFDDDYKGNDNYVNCKSKFLRGANPILQQLFDDNGNFNKQRDFFLTETFLKTIRGLNDSLYTLHLNCSDRVGNVNYSQTSFNIVGDQRIFDISPVLVTNTSFTNLSFHFKYGAAQNAQCAIKRITENDSASSVQFSSMTPVANPVQMGSNDYQYTTNAIQSLSSSGFYLYQIKCQYIDATNSLRTTNSDGHRAIFAIDKDPPVINVSIYDGVTDVTSKYWELKAKNENYSFTHKAQLVISCADPDIYGNGRHWNFGWNGCKIYQKDASGNYVFKANNKFTLSNIDTTKVYEFMASDGVNSAEESIDMSFDFDIAKLSISVFDWNNNPVNMLTPGLYTVSISSTKPIDEVQSALLNYGLVGENFFVNCPSLLQSSNKFNCTLAISNGEAISSRLATFIFSVKDYHNILSERIVSGKTILLDTTKPNRIALLPGFLDKYYTGIISNINALHYTNRNVFEMFGNTYQPALSYMAIEVYDSNTNSFDSFSEQPVSYTALTANQISLSRDAPDTISVLANDINPSTIDGQYIRISGNNVQLYRNNPSSYPNYARFFKILSHDAVQNDKIVLHLDDDVYSYWSAAQGVLVYSVATNALNYNIFNYSMRLQPGQNNFEFVSRQGDSLESVPLVIDMVRDNIAPRITTDISKTITNNSELIFTYVVCDDGQYESKLNMSKLNVTVSNSAGISKLNSVATTNMPQACHSEQRTANLALGYNNITLHAEDNAYNAKNQIYRIYYDPNAMLVVDFSVLPSQIADGIEFNSITYNGIPAINDLEGHNYSIQFSHSANIARAELNARPLGEYGVSYSLADKTINFSILNSDLLPDINVITINASKEQPDKHYFIYDLPFIFDSEKPDFTMEIPNLTRGMTFAVSSQVMTEQYDLKSFDLNLTCRDPDSVKTMTSYRFAKGIDGLYYATVSLSPLYLLSSCDFVFTATDIAGNSETKIVTKAVDSSAPALGIVSVEKSASCDPSLYLNKLSDTEYLSQCAVLNVTFRVGDDAKNLKYSTIYASSLSTLRNVTVDLTNPSYRSGGYKYFSLLVPLDVRQVPEKYSLITTTNLGIYTDDGNRQNYDSIDLYLKYRDKNYRQPPNVILAVKDMNRNDVSSLTFGNYFVYLSSDTAVMKKPINITYIFGNQQQKETLLADDYSFDYEHSWQYAIEETDFNGWLKNKNMTVKFVIELEDELGLKNTTSITYPFDSVYPVIAFEPSISGTYYYNGNAFNYMNKIAYTKNNTVIIGINSTKISTIAYLPDNLLQNIDTDNPFKLDVVTNPMTQSKYSVKSLSTNALDVYAGSSFHIHDAERFGFSTFTGQALRANTYPFYGSLYLISSSQDMPTSPATIHLIASDPVSYFMNLHTTANPLSIGFYNTPSRFVDRFTSMDLSLLPGRTTYEIAGYDASINPSNKLNFTAVYDDQNPFVSDYGPIGCTINWSYVGGQQQYQINPTAEYLIYANISDFKSLSPYTSINLFIDSDSAPITANYAKSDSGNYNSYYISKMQPLETGSHSAKVVALDLAGNSYEYGWNFTIDNYCLFNTSFNVANSVYFARAYMINNSNMNFNFAISFNPASYLSNAENSILSVTNITLLDVDNNVMHPVSYDASGLTVAGNSVLIGNSLYVLRLDLSLQSGSTIHKIPVLEYNILYDSAYPRFNVTIPNITYSGALMNVIANLDAGSKLDTSNSREADDFNLYNGSFCFNDVCSAMDNYDSSHLNQQYTVPQLQTGWYPYTVTLTDLAGNTNSYNGNIYVDNDLPQYTIFPIFPAGKKNLTLDDETMLTNSNTAIFDIQLQGNLNSVYVKRLTDSDLLYRQVQLDSFRHGAVNFSLNQFDNRFVFKLKGDNTRTYYKGYNLVFDNKAPQIIESSIRVK